MKILQTFMAFALLLKSSATGLCPNSTGSFKRVGQTRFFIVHPNERGGFVSRNEAQMECNKRGLQMATVKNLLTMAVVGRELEQLAYDEKLQDTWYWLDGKFDENKQQYIWMDSKELEFTLFLYRAPRPIGIGKHINYNNIYQPDADKPQCLTVTLPHPGSADHDENTNVFFGHHTTFDERDCNSKSKRHAICESQDQDCNSCEPNPYTLDEGKEGYFYDGQWISGRRTYVINWKQKNFKDSHKFCKLFGLKLLTAGKSDNYLTPHIKMWSREITVAQFWTSMKFNTATKQFLDESGSVVPSELLSANFTASNVKVKSASADTLLCVVLSVSFEFIEQMPCSIPSSAGCKWSFFRYVPANCNNKHGSICQHKDHKSREITWTSKPNDLTEVLEATAVTSEFGYMGNNKVLRSKYKQTFGLFYCPDGYRILRSEKNSFIAWSLKPTNKTEFYEYDYNETYWVIDEEMYEKTEDSSCTAFSLGPNQHKFEQVNCTEWHFYLCIKLGRRPGKKLEGDLNVAPPMKWKPGPQPRVYPILNVDPKGCGLYNGKPCECKVPGRGAVECEYNSVTNRCVKSWKECPSRYFHDGFCQRQGAHIFYAIAGIVCSNQVSNTNCIIEKTLYSANFGGSRFARSGKDGRNIEFRWYGGKSQFEDPLNIFDESGQNQQASGILSSERFLYQGYMWGWTPWPAKPVRCTSLTLNLSGDGYYEISFKTGEFAHTHNRVFSIRLNDQFIVDEIEIQAYRKFGLGLELNVNFKISQAETMIEIQGHPVRKLLQPKKIKLMPCTSKCKAWAQDLNYSFNAISIVKFVKQ